MSVLPKEIAYNQKLAALPASTTATSIVVAPSNGQSFTSGGSIIYFDLPARGYLVPSSMYLRYKLATGATAAGFLKGTPFATPFLRSEVLIGSQVVECIQQYNQLYNIMVNTKLSVGQKMGMACALGYTDLTTTLTSTNMNGRYVASGDSYSLAGPLGNILSNCDHLVPLGMMPSCRIQLTTDTVSNMYNTSLTGYKLNAYQILVEDETGSEKSGKYHFLHRANLVICRTIQYFSNTRVLRRSSE